MATAVFGSPIQKVYGETVSLTTTAASLALMPAYQEVMLYCASAFRMGLAPKLAHALVYNGTTYTEYSSLVTDRDSSTHLPLDGMTTATYLYLCFEPYCPRGFYIDVGSNVNAVASSSLDVEYYNGSAWTDVASDSDGSSSGGVTLAQDGVYTFTLPASVETKINGLNGHWIRFCPNKTLSTTIDVNEIIPICDTTNYGYMEGGVAYQFSINQVKVGGFEFDHTSTGTLDVTWIQH